MTERSVLDVTQEGTGVDEEKEADNDNAPKKVHTKQKIRSIRQNLEDVRRDGGKTTEDPDEKPKYDITMD
jgi:hypothetical protein